MLQLIPILNKQPNLPASNAAVELRIRQTLEPFLENRKHLYRNIARTNFLLDLATVRAQGGFLNLDHLAQFIRDNNEAFRGWAPTPRSIVDEQPTLPVAGKTILYSSLLNPLLLPALAKTRGLVEIEPAVPRKSYYKPTGRPRGRPRKTAKPATP